MTERLQQPMEFVREVLKEVAEYQATGPYHGVSYLFLFFLFPPTSPAGLVLM